MFTLLRRAHLVAAFALVATLTACGGPTVYPVIGTARTPGTDGTVEIESQDGGNYLVTVELEHLPPPARLGDNLTTYVVWFIRDGNAPSLAGVLVVDEDDRSGRLMATTPYTQFRIRVTAEESRDVGQPSDTVIAEQVVEEN